MINANRTLIGKVWPGSLHQFPPKFPVPLAGLFAAITRPCRKQAGSKQHAILCQGGIGDMETVQVEAGTGLRKPEV
jgi:hypothetical protein